jgi:hypothetical protein
MTEGNMKEKWMKEEKETKKQRNDRITNVYSIHMRSNNTNGLHQVSY